MSFGGFTGNFSHHTSEKYLLTQTVLSLQDLVYCPKKLLALMWTDRQAIDHVKSVGIKSCFDHGD